MTKRQQLGFTFLTCGLAALATVACSDSGGEDNPLAATGGASGGNTTPGTGGALGTGGSSATGTGGDSTNPGTGGTSTTTTPTDGSYSVAASGFVTSGAWTGYAWVGTEENAAFGTTINPADFTGVLAGGTLCVNGSVGMDADYGGVAMLGMNVAQAVDGEEGSEGVWASTGTTGIRYSVTNTANSPLRIQIQGAAGYPDEAWCASAKQASGEIPWTDFNKTCWDNKGTFYDQDGAPALESVMFLVPGDDNTATPFEFCVNAIGPY